MAIYNLDISNENYIAEVLSYFLWGQKNAPSPSEITDEKWIGRDEEIVLKIDRDQFASKYGHLYNAKDFKLVEVFFSGKDRKGGTLNRSQASTYTKNKDNQYILTHEQFVDLFYSIEVMGEEINKNLKNEKKVVTDVSFYKRGGDHEFGKRAFVFGSTKSYLDIENIRYVLDEDFNPIRIDDFNMIVNKYNDDLRPFNLENYQSIGGLLEVERLW
ncbi:MAG TPA: hypothetical protein ENK66_06635 [Arcobacter sp.]|nr:hypothetical protein [Arcobacter sp.]